MGPGGMHPHHQQYAGAHHPGLSSHHLHGGSNLHPSLGFGAPSSSSMGMGGMGGVALSHPHHGGGGNPGYGQGGYGQSIFDVPGAMQRRASMPGPVSDLHHHPSSLHPLSSHHQHQQQQQQQQQHPHHTQQQMHPSSSSGLQLYGTSSAPSGYANPESYGLRGTLPRPSLPAALPSAGYGGGPGGYSGQTTPQRLPSLSLNASPARGYAFPDNGLAGVDGE